MKSSLSQISLLASLLAILAFSDASSTNNTSPKRGLCYIATSNSQTDDSVLTRPNSPLTWYYNYSPWPGPSSALTAWTTEFVPMVHSASEAESSVDTLKGILDGSLGVRVANNNNGDKNTITHVLTYNEPDGDTSSGGSNSSPKHAAQVWMSQLAPLRQPPYNLKLSLPATTGSSNGIDWLREFNTSCHSLNKTHGCEFDFVATHWYGDFGGLTSWLGQIHDLYPSQKIWLTEFAIPAASVDETQALMNQSLPYLDGLGYVERYSWFGAFRESSANGWTGKSVSLFDNDGGLTQLGATWMGGRQDGFEVGTSANGNENGAGVSSWNRYLVVLGLGMVLWQYLF